MKPVKGRRTRPDPWQPPLPPSDDGRSGPLKRWRMSRRNILAALPRRLFRAWMAETRTPAFCNYLINQPELVQRVLVEEPDAFPKHPLYRRALRDLLGDSLFVSRPGDWARQRALVEQAFENGRLKESFLPMSAACDVLVGRLRAAEGPIEIEREASCAAADVIFRALFSMPLERDLASDVFAAFRDYQASAPMVSLPGLFALGGLFSHFGTRARSRRRAALRIRTMLDRMIDQRAEEIRAGTAPDDFATALMTISDPQTGEGLDRSEIADQMALFFLAGHETSAAALSWALYLVAGRPALQGALRAEADKVFDGRYPRYRDLGRLHLARDVFREAMRLYPPIPMLVRRSRCSVSMRGRMVSRGSGVVVSTWHLHRHERIWDNPHDFKPERWRSAEARRASHGAYLPFSLGPRACLGAGFALQEGVLFLSRIVQALDLTHVGPAPEPVAQLTIRAPLGIWLKLSRRSAQRAQLIQDEEANG